MLLCQILAYAIHGKIKTSYKNNKFKISAPKYVNKIENRMTFENKTVLS